MICVNESGIACTLTGLVVKVAGMIAFINIGPHQHDTRRRT